MTSKSNIFSLSTEIATIQPFKDVCHLRCHLQTTKTSHLSHFALEITSAAPFAIETRAAFDTI